MNIDMATPFKRTFRTPGMKKIYRPPNVLPEETIDCDQLWLEEVAECSRKYAKELLQLKQDAYEIRSDEESELDYIFLSNLSAVLHPGKIRHFKSVFDRRVRRTSSLKRSKPVDKIDGSRLRSTVNDRANQFLKVATPDDPSFYAKPRSNIYEDNDFLSKDIQPSQQIVFENQELINVTGGYCQTDIIQGRKNNIVETEKPTIVLTVETPCILLNSLSSPPLQIEQTKDDQKIEMPDTPIEKDVIISEQTALCRKENKRLKPEQNPMIKTNLFTESKESDSSDPLTALLDQDQQELNQETSALLLRNHLKKVPQNDKIAKDIPTDLPKFGPPSSYRSFRRSPLNKGQSIDTPEHTLDSRSGINHETSSTSSSLLRSNFQRNRPSSFSVFDKSTNVQSSLSDRLRNFPSRNIPLSKDTINEAPKSSSSIHVQEDKSEISQQVVLIKSERTENISQSSPHSSIDKSVSYKSSFDILSVTPSETPPKSLIEPLAAIITDNQLDGSLKAESSDFPPPEVQKTSLLTTSQKSIDGDLPQFVRTSAYSSLRESRLGRFQSVDSNKYTTDTVVKNDDKIIEIASSQRMKNFARSKPSSFPVSDKQYDLPVIYNRSLSNASHNLSKDTVTEVPRPAAVHATSIDRQTNEPPTVHAESEKIAKQNQLISQSREPSLTGVAVSSSSMSQDKESSNIDTLKQTQIIGLSVSDASSESCSSNPILERIDRYSIPVLPVTTQSDTCKISPGVDRLSKNVECAPTTFVRRGSQRTISSGILNRFKTFENPDVEQKGDPGKHQKLGQTSSNTIIKPASEMVIENRSNTLIKTSNEALKATPSEPITRTPGDKLIRTATETLMQRFDRNRPGSFSVGDKPFEISKNGRSSNYRVRTGYPSNDIICETAPNSSSNNNVENNRVKISSSFTTPTHDSVINVDTNGVVIRNKPSFQPKYGPPSSYKRVSNRESNEIEVCKASNESNDQSNSSADNKVGSRSSRIDTLKAKFDDQIVRSRPGSFSTRDVKYDTPKYGSSISNRLLRSDTDNRSTTLNVTRDVSNDLPDNDQFDRVVSSKADTTISSSDDSIEIPHGVFPNSEKPSDIRKFNRLPMNYRLRRSGHVTRVSSSDLPDTNLPPPSQIAQNIDLSASQSQIPEDKIINNFRRTRPNSFQVSDVQHQPESIRSSGNGSVPNQNDRPVFSRKWNSPQKNIIHPTVTPRNDLNNNYVRNNSVLSNVQNESVPKYNRADSCQSAAPNSLDQSSSNVSSPNVPTYSSRTSLQLTKPSPAPVDGTSLLVKAADSFLGSVQRKISIFNYRDLIRTQSVSDKRNEFGTNRGRTLDQLQADRLGQSFNVQR